MQPTTTTLTGFSHVLELGHYSNTIRMNTREQDILLGKFIKTTAAAASEEH